MPRLTAITQNNFQSAPGQTKGYFTVSNITTNTDLKSLDEFRDMVVKASGGTLIRLKDVGTVDLSAQSYDSSVLMNGQHAVFIGVETTPTGNPLNVVADIRKMQPDLERSLPGQIESMIRREVSNAIDDAVFRVVAETQDALARALGQVVERAVKEELNRLRNEGG